MKSCAAELKICESNLFPVRKMSLHFYLPCGLRHFILQMVHKELNVQCILYCSQKTLRKMAIGMYLKDKLSH